MHIHPFNLDQVVAERNAHLLRRVGRVRALGRRTAGRGADGPTGAC